MYSAVNSHKCVQNIDNALSAGDYHTLMDITDLNDFEAMLSNEVESTYEQCADSADSELVKPGIEMKLLTMHAQLIADLEKESEDDPEHVCCSCECLYQRKSVTRVKLSDNLSEDMWPTLKQYILEVNPAADDQTLYIIVNGKPTTSKVVWRSLVNVDNVKTAVQKLREINWLYSEVKDSVDDVSKKVIEIADNASSTVLDKADERDISGFQAFTIRNLDNKLSTESDIEQYKLLSVREDPIDNRQQHLDVMCFPKLYPTGKYHPRDVKISHSEFDKSRLLNKDSHFRKDPQYVFYLL